MDDKELLVETEETEKKKKKIVSLIFLIIFIMAFVFALWKIVSLFSKKDNSLAKKVTDSAGANNAIKTTEKLPDNPIDFKQLTAQNSEITGWIYLSMSDPNKIDFENKDDISYPILQSGIDNPDDNFYLDHNEKKESARAGALYIQKDNSADFSDFNTVVYGHNMMNGSMFGKLKKFRNKEFFNTYRKFYVYVPGHIKEYEIVSAFIFDDRLILSSYKNFMSPDDKISFINTCKNPSTLVRNVVDGVKMEITDELVTLSTCTSADSERYLVVGKLVKDIKTK